MSQKTFDRPRFGETRKASLEFFSSRVERPEKIRSASVSAVSRNWSPVISHFRKDDIIFELPPCIGPDGKLPRALQSLSDSTPPDEEAHASSDHPSSNDVFTYDKANADKGGPTTDDDMRETSTTATITPLKPVATISRPDSTNSFKEKFLGAIQPEFYEAPSNKVHYGSICFSMVYDGAVETLTVKVIKVKQLLPRSSVKDVSTRNCFVRVFLLPDENNFHQTKTRCKCNNPVFNEEFPFQVTYSIKGDKTIRFSVYDETKKSCILLGHALINLDDVAFSKPNDEMWKELDKPARPGEISLALHGSIHISLSYNPTSGRLGVFISTVKDLNLLNLEETAGINVKLVLHKDNEAVKTKKTTTKLSTSCLTFNESISFHVERSSIEQMFISAAVVAHESSDGTLRRFSSSVKNSVLRRKKSRRVCGHVTFGRSGNHGKEESHHWKEMLARPGKAIPKWHFLHEAPKPNFNSDE